MAKVIVFGSMNMDLSVECPRVPAAGETISGGGFITAAGGKGANQAVAAARLGAQTHMVAAVGEDAFGPELVRGLEDSGVDCAHVRRVAEKTTGVAVIVRSQGDNRIILDAGANHALDAADVEQSLCALASLGDVFVVQGECDLATTAEALRLAHDLGCFTVLNTAPAWDVPRGAWQHVDLACMNETECELVCGILPSDDKSCQAAAELLRSWGAGSVVITLGSSGAAAVDDDGAFIRVPAAVAPQVVDTTAAGDTFVGALAAGRARGFSLAKSMRWGAAVSAVTVSRLGAQPSIPTADEVAFS